MRNQGTVAQGPLSGPAALPAVRVLAAPPISEQRTGAATAIRKAHNQQITDGGSSSLTDGAEGGFGFAADDG